ncbi:MAG: response regulator [Acidimicrobiales bacterium]|nr:response regulator [Acidimicrobiales bacterium]
MATNEQLTVAEQDATRTAILKQTWPLVREFVGEQVDVVDAAALALLTPGAIFDPVKAERMAHRLAGSLGSFGIPIASDEARELEVLLGGLAVNNNADAPTKLRVADLAVRLREHVAHLDRAFAPEPPSSEDIDGASPRPLPVVEEIDLRLLDVAVVEDDSVTARLIEHALQQSGISTKLFTDGAEAAEALGGRIASVRPRVVLLDVDLPSLNGLDVLRHLQRTGTLEHIKVIMLTARCGESETIQAFDLGAIDHVAKPFSHEVLVRRVQLALG